MGRAGGYDRIVANVVEKGPTNLTVPREVVVAHTGEQVEATKCGGSGGTEDCYAYGSVESRETARG